MMPKTRSYLALAALMMVAAAALATGGSEDWDGSSAEFGRARNFDAIHNSTSADLEIRIGDRWSVQAQGTREMLEDLRVEVQRDVLVIERKRPMLRLPRGSRVSIEIVVPRLSELRLTGSGDAKLTGDLRAETFDLRATGSGSTEFEGDVGRLSIQAQGSGDVRFEGRARQTSLQLTGSGEADLDIRTDEIEGRITGSGSITLRGEANRGDFTLTGSGDLEAGRFVMQDVTLILTGSGSAEVDVRGTLSGRLTGSGDLAYSGDPILELRSTGSGKAREMD
jgi:hypothetical protein